MGVLYDESVATTTISGGTNLKRLIMWAIEKSAGKLAVLETTTDTADEYSVVLYAFGDTNVALRIRHKSSGRVYRSTLIRCASGTVSAGGITNYHEITLDNFTYSDLITASAAINCRACMTGSSVHVSFGGKIEFTFLQLTDRCSGAAYTAATHTLSWGGYVTNGDSYSSSGFAGVDDTNNGYIRACPLNVVCEDVKLTGYCGSPPVLYYIVADGAYLTVNPWAEITVGGHNFVRISGSSVSYPMFVRLT